MENYNKAIKEIYNILGVNEPDIENDRKHDYLTDNVARNGRDILWYLDESNNIAIYVDTLERLTEEEIEKELM